MQLLLLWVKVCLLAITTVLLTTKSNAQAPNCHWISTLSGSNVQSFGTCDADEHGNLYSFGFTSGKTKQTNFFSSNDQVLNDSVNIGMVLTKTDPAGQFVWTKELINLFGYFTQKMVADQNGSFYVAGTFYGNATFDPSNPSNSTLVSLNPNRLSYYIAKYNLDGQLLWAKSIDASSVSGSIEDISISNNGELTIAGSFDSLMIVNNNSFLSQGGIDAFLAVYDSDGNFQSINTWGTAFDDKITSFCFDAAGMTYLSLTTNATQIDADPSNGVQLVDLTFNLFFVKSILVKLNSNGQLLWAKTALCNRDHYLNSIRISPTGELCAAGVFAGQLSPDFSGLNTATYLANDTSLIDSYLAKYNLNGDLVWFKNIDTGVMFSGLYQRILFDDIGNIHTSGFFFGNADFDPDLSINTYSAISVNPFIWSLTSNGDYRWTIPLISENSAWAYSFALTNQAKNLYVVGDFSGALQFDDSPGYTLTSEMASETEYSADGYIAKYSTCDLLVNIEFDTVCDSVYSWNNQIIDESGTYFQVIQDNFQCDSISILELQINKPTTENLILSDCNPVTFNNQIIDVSGEYTQTLLNSVGCDSILKIQFTRLFESVANLDVSACEPVQINSTIYNQSGSYIQSLINSAGCDSTLNIEITLETPSVFIYSSDTALHASGNFSTIQWVSCPNFEPISGANTKNFTATPNQEYAAIVSIGECTDTTNCRLFLLPRIACESLLIYPNPIQNSINFKYNKESYPIDLYSSNGARVYTNEGNTSTQTIDVSSFSSGLYLLRVDNCIFKLVK